MLDNIDKMGAMYSQLSEDFLKYIAYCKELRAENANLRSYLRNAVWIIEHSGYWNDRSTHLMPEGNTVQDRIEEFMAALAQEEGNG